MPDVALKFDDVLAVPKTTEIRGKRYRFAPDLPAELAVLNMTTDIEAMKAQAELDALAKATDEGDPQAVAAAVASAEQITQRMIEFSETVEAKVLEFFNDEEYRLEPVEKLPLSVGDFFGKLVPYLYEDVSLTDLVDRREGEGGAAADPTQANARRVRAQGGTKNTKAPAKAKKKPSSSSTS